MTTDVIPRFVFSRPFEPFALSLSGGREVEVHRADRVAVGDYVLTLYVVHLSGQVEVIDVDHVASIRTLRGVNLADYIR